MLLERVAETIARYGMVRCGQTVGVAVSGGADSMCLLHALVLLAPRWELRLRVLHLDHNLRAEESRQDAAFVRRAAALLGLEATVEQTGLSGTGDNLEQAGRRARTEFFHRAISSGAVDRVATGHTRSDQAETVLFRFLRGSGTAGLSGIRPVRSDGLIRPLIEVERQEVERFLRERSVEWREDSSNRSARFARNRIRHSLLPQLAGDWNPALVATLSQTAEWAQAEEAYWEEELDRLSAGRLFEEKGAVLLKTADFSAMPPAAARRLVRRAMERARGGLRGIAFRHVEQVLEMAAGSKGYGRAEVPGLEAVRSFGWLRLAPPGESRGQDYRLAAEVPGRLQVPGNGGEISLELIEKPETFETSESVYNSDMGCLDWRRLPSPLELRSWTAGDRYQPFGNRGSQKIKTLFQRARIPVWERRGWPVLWSGNEIVWTRHFGASAQAVANCSSSLILRVTESGVQ